MTTPDPARQREAALREILDLISRSREDAAPVFDAILHRAADLCGADGAALILGKAGDAHQRMVAHYGAFAINAPISLDVLLTFAWLLSKSDCSFFLSSSNAIIVSTNCSSAKYFTANFSFTPSGFCLNTCTCNMLISICRKDKGEGTSCKFV